MLRPQRLSDGCVVAGKSSEEPEDCAPATSSAGLPTASNQTAAVPRAPTRQGRPARAGRLVVSAEKSPDGYATSGQAPSGDCDAENGQTEQCSGRQRASRDSCGLSPVPPGTPFGLPCMPLIVCTASLRLSSSAEPQAYTMVVVPSANFSEAGPMTTSFSSG